MRFVNTSSRLLKETTSYLILTLDTTFEELCSKLGKPKNGPSSDGKTKVEWTLLVEDELGNNAILTIYDWKEYDIPLNEITEWHVGGTDNDLHLARVFLFNELKFKEGE